MPAEPPPAGPQALAELADTIEANECHFHETDADCRQYDCDTFFNQTAHLSENREAIKTALRALAEMRGAGWQPIETVPKDGTFVLLGLNYKGRSIAADDQWSDEHEQWVYWWDTVGDNIEPTHWMHLPTVPTQEPGNNER